jgi:hypothetical protein
MAGLLVSAGQNSIPFLESAVLCNGKMERIRHQNGYGDRSARAAGLNPNDLGGVLIEPDGRTRNEKLGS